MCCLSSLYGISDGLTNDSKFYLALLGQVRNPDDFMNQQLCIILPRSRR